MVPQTGPYMSPQLRTVLGVSLALFLLMGAVVLAGIGVEGLTGVDVPGLEVWGADTDGQQDGDGTADRTVEFPVSTEWVMRNGTRDQLRQDWSARQNGTERPDSYCLRTRSLFDAGAEVYDPMAQEFEDRSTGGSVTDDVCAGTHPVVLRPDDRDCSMAERDVWMLGHIGIDATIVQCGPDAFILYTDDDFSGQYVPRPGRNVSVDESGNVSAGRIPVELG